MLKIFFEVNVLLDFILERSTIQNHINAIFDELENNRISEVVSISVIQTCIFYLNQAKGTQVTWDIIHGILQKFELIEGKYEDVSSALNSSHSYIEDSIHYHMALRNQMDAILTSDKNLLKLSKPFLPIITPEELKKRIEF